MRRHYPKSTIQVAALIKRKWGGCKTWSRDGLLRWVQWFADKGRLVGVFADGKVAAVVLFRFVDSVKDIRDSEFTDTDGELCYVALCISKEKKFIRAMYPVFWNAGLSSRKSVCWARDKYNLREITMSLAQFGRRFGYG